MSSGPRSLRLGKRGGGSIRLTGCGCGIILTGGWSRPPGNTSRDKRQSITLAWLTTYISHFSETSVTAMILKEITAKKNICNNSRKGNQFSDCFISISKSKESQWKLVYLWAEAVVAEAEEGFGGEGPERQQTTGPAVRKEVEPGLEHWMWLGEVVTGAWWGLPSSS